MTTDFSPSPLFERVERARRRRRKIKDTHITLAHGSGGRAMHELVEGLFREMLDDAASRGSLDAVHAMRDPTRGGAATTLNEIALASEVCIEIQEDRIPVREEVKGACEILGLDPLYVANEGKLIAVVAGDIADALVGRMRQNPYGRGACVIGDVKAEPQGIVAMRTGFGGTRIVDMLVGEQPPRIC